MDGLQHDHRGCEDKTPPVMDIEVLWVASLLFLAPSAAMTDYERIRTMLSS